MDTLLNGHGGDTRAGRAAMWPVRNQRAGEAERVSSPLNGGLQEVTGVTKLSETICADVRGLHSPRKQHERGSSVCRANHLDLGWGRPLGRVAARALRALSLCALLLPFPLFAQDAPGGVSSGLSAWYDAGTGIPQGTTNVTANWTQRGGSAGESPLTRQGNNGTIDTVSGAFNFNPALEFKNPTFDGFGRMYGGPSTRDREWITPNSAGSAFGVGVISDQVSSLARGSGSTCGSDAGRCNVGFRPDAGGGTNFGGNPSGTPYANGVGNVGPTANIYGLWASVGVGQHRNTRNGWTATGEGVTKQIASDYQFRIGSFPGFTYNGRIAEVFYYNRKLTEAEAQRISTYLGVKYGVTLEGDATRNNTTNYDYISSTGVVVWDGTGTTTVNAYHRNVFGLGRDSALDQRIGTNINDSGPIGTYPLDILTMATGTLASPAQFTATHQSTGTQLSQGQYLMVGNNNASTTAVTSAAVSGVSTSLDNGTWSRLNRLWRVQNTGSVGTVSLLFNVPAAGVTALGGNLNKVVLLVDNDGNYTNGGTRVVISGRSVSGTQISFNVALADGEIFTLASSTETLTLIKTTVQAAGTYTFSLTGTTQSTGSVIMAASATTTVDGNTGIAGTQSFAISSAGTAVTITEGVLPAGVNLAGMTCTNATSGVTFSPVYDVAARSVSIPGSSVNAGANITCTYTNAVTQPDFGTCDGRMYLSITNSSPTPDQTTLHNINYATNPFTLPVLGVGSIAYNAIGYNPLDNYLYGIENDAFSGNELLRIGSDGSTLNLGTITLSTGGNLLDASYYAGAISPTGDYYTISAGSVSSRLYRVNLSTRVATLISLSQAINVQDFVWVNGLLYTVESGQLLSIDPVTGAVTTIGSTGALSSAFALWGSPTGLFGWSGSSSFYKIDLATGQTTVISTMPTATGADGANCPTAPILFSTDVAVTKTNTPAQGTNDLPGDGYTQGSARTYSIVVSNIGPFGVQNATVSDPVPAGIDPATVSWTCGSATGGAVCGATSGTGALNDTGLDLPRNATVTYQLTMTVPAGFTGDLANVVTVSLPSGTTDTNPANNSATDVDQAVPRLTLRKISINGVDSFGFTGTNGVVAQTLVTTVAGTPVSGAPQSLTSAGTSTTITESTTPATYGVTDITCTGLGAGGTATPDLANRTVVLDAAATVAGSSIECTFTNTLQQTDIRVVKTASPDPVLSGQVVTYSLVVSNNGPLAASNVLLTDVAGAGQDCTTPSTTATCTASGGATCPSATVPVSSLLGSGISIPSLPVGGQATFTLQCTVTATGNP